MANVYSWKLDKYKYAYIYIPGNKSHISTRITNVATIKAIADEVKWWTSEKYAAAFAEMNDEVSSQYGGKVIGGNPDDYFTEGAAASNVFMLTGRDGENTGVNGGLGESSADTDRTLQALNTKIEQANREISDINSSLMNSINSLVYSDLKDAQNSIKEAENRIMAAHSALTEELRNAQNVIDEIKNGEIPFEEIANNTKGATEWLNRNSGNVETMLSDYDEATQSLGTIGSSSAATTGTFSKFVQSINAQSGTMGTITETVSALSGNVETIAKWFDTNAESATVAAQWINASAATIGESVQYTTREGIANLVESELDAREASITDNVISATSARTVTINRNLSALSAFVETNCVVKDNNGNIVNIGQKFDAMSANYETYITSINELNGKYNDMRDEWSASSGMIRSVSETYFKTDSEGNIIYYIINGSGDDIVVTKCDDYEETKQWEDSNGIRYNDSLVAPRVSDEMKSYIQQTASSVTMSVVGESGLTAAITASISGDTSLINMIANQVNISADLVAKALSAETANIGGVEIGNGSIKSSATNSEGKPLFELNGNNATMSVSKICFDGYIRIPYVNILKLTRNANREYLAENNSYLWFNGPGGTTLRLPDATEDMNGMTYHIISRQVPQTKVGGETGFFIKSNSAIYIYAFMTKDEWSGNTIQVYGGHIEITCVDEIGWIVTQCTGGLNTNGIYEADCVNYTPIFSLSSTPDKAISNVIPCSVLPPSASTNAIYFINNNL